MGQLRSFETDRREPSLGLVRQAVIDQATGRTVSRAELAYERAEESRPLIRQAALVSLAKVALWLLAWCLMAYGCHRITIAAGTPDYNVALSDAFLAGTGTVVMLAVTFWRIVWRMVWWCIGALIVLAVIKGAFLIVFGL